MKKLTCIPAILIVIFLINTGIYAQSEQHTGRLLKNIRSANQENIKKCKIKTATAYDCDIDVARPVSLCRYDATGRLIDSIGYPYGEMRRIFNALSGTSSLDPSSYEGDDVIEFKYHYSYNDKDLRVQIVTHTTSRVENSNVLLFADDTTNYTYDENDRLTRALRTNRKGFMVQDDNYSYDANGNVLTWKQFLSGSPRNFTNTYTYDSQNNLVEYARVDGSGEFFAREKCTYDVNGNMTVWENFSKSGANIYQKNFKYDNRNNMIECLGYIEGIDFDSKLQKTYDDAGNVVETIFSSGRITGQGDFIFKDRRRETFGYDANNNLTQKNTYDRKGDVINSVSYRYDENNILTSISFSPGACTRFEYEYYK